MSNAFTASRQHVKSEQRERAICLGDTECLMIAGMVCQPYRQSYTRRFRLTEMPSRSFPRRGLL